MRRATSIPPELPGYTYVKLLGSGGFSDVFLYDQHLPKRRVAVKVLLAEELAPTNRASFVAEANLMAQLSAHPYIVSIFHADVAPDDRPYFVMEYCSGPSLAERYKREQMSVADVLRTGVRVAGAVATAHAAGILHRDIKPANVLTNDFGWPALTDFGISSTVDDEIPLHTATLDALIDDSGGGTGSASVGMSVPWSPPEMFEDNPSPDVRADVFSLAATLYTLLAGHTPFEVRGRSNGALDLIGRIERGLITPLERDDVPSSLVAVLSKAMASRREDRFASTVEFARALQRVELELNYAPTTIDVPNLIVDSSVRSGSVDDEDATRARGVATIEAQTTAPDSDATRIRGATRVDAQTEPQMFGETVRRKPSARAIKAPEPTPPAEAATEPDGQPHSRRNHAIAWVTGGLLAVVAAAVAVSLVVTGVPDAMDPPTKPTPSEGGAAVVELIPTPQLLSVQAGSTVLNFTVMNPDAREGDSMTWRRVDRGSDEPRRRTAEDGTFTVDGFDGSPVCVEVHVVRLGRESANPLETCFPK